jgi:ornithine--oxo-acid transaminase
MIEEKQEIISREAKVCATNYRSLPVVLSRGKGVWIWDVQGRRYLDMMSAYSAVSHGHGHPRLLKVLREQSERLSVCSRAYHNDKLAPFLEKVCTISCMERALPMNTGAEAVETAIKAIRRWGYQVKKIPSNQAEIIVADNNFHGRTTTIISFSSDINSRKDFGPYTPGFVHVPFNNAQAIERAINANTCAVLVEPIQGEAGIIVPDPGWLTKVSNICKRHNVLLIVDEVQSGLGRTGQMFAFMHDNILPDGLILGKALGGGILPVSVFLARKDVMDVFTPASHGSTFGGNSLAAAIALEAINVIEEEELVERSAKLGKYFLERLQDIDNPLIVALRGRGLWIGMEIDTRKINTFELCKHLLNHGILTKDTHDTTIRLAPALIITKEEIDFVVKRIEDTLKMLV